jgi:hypothetical protein
LRELSRELKHLVVVFGPKSWFAQFRIFELSTLWEVVWSADLQGMAGGASKPQLLSRTNHGEPQSQTLILQRQGLLHRENEE